MKGLIKKDLLVMKSNMKLYLIIIGMYALFSVLNIMDVAFIMPFMVMMSFISTFNYDDYNHWNAFALTFPNARKDIVKSKYVASLFLLLGSFILTIVVSLLSAVVGEGALNLFAIGAETLVCVAMVAMIISVMYPVIFKYGAEKGRTVMFLVTFLVAGAIGVLSTNGGSLNEVSLETFLEKFWFVCFVIVPSVCVYVSYLVSSKIFAKKEF